MGLHLWWYARNLESNGELSIMRPNLTADPNRPDANLYGKQAYTCSYDVRFRKFASEQEPNATIEYVHDVAEFIARRCGVEVPRLIDDTPEAIKKWQALKAEYDTWLGSQNTKS
jgi:hypothetical protein